MHRRLLFAVPVAAVALGLTFGGESPAVAAPAELPPGKLGEVVALGRDIVERTNEHPLTKGLVGNDLTCSSCHLDAGTDPINKTKMTWVMR